MSERRYTIHATLKHGGKEVLLVEADHYLPHLVKPVMIQLAEAATFERGEGSQVSIIITETWIE